MTGWPFKEQWNREMPERSSIWAFCISSENEYHKTARKPLSSSVKPQNKETRMRSTNWVFCIIRGQGVPQDHEKAVKLFNDSAAQGNEEVKKHYKTISEVKTAERVKIEAKKIRKVAEQGEVGAQFSLGLMCETGTRVPKDTVKAKALIGKAAAQGNNEAKDYRRCLKKYDKAENNWRQKYTMNNATHHSNTVSPLSWNKHSQKREKTQQGTELSM